MQDPKSATMTPPSGLPVVPGAPSWLVLEPEPAATPLARAHTRDLLGKDQPADDVQVIVSELVTNAVVHAPDDGYVVPADVSPHIHLSLQAEQRWILAGVRDPWPGTPHALRVGDQYVSGRGLAIVTALSAAWWVEFRSVGKTVYALVLRPGCALRPGELDRLRRP